MPGGPGRPGCVGAGSTGAPGATGAAGSTGGRTENEFMRWYSSLSYSTSWRSTIDGGRVLGGLHAHVLEFLASLDDSLDDHAVLLVLGEHQWWTGGFALLVDGAVGVSLVAHTPVAGSATVVVAGLQDGGIKLYKK